jgi:hypothetical protein
VATLYLETSNYQREADVDRAADVARFIEAAHERDIRVVAWYLPGFIDPNLDIRRSLAAIRFETPAGQGFDGFAMDIESAEVDPVSQRVKVMLRVSQRVRDAVGDDYALGAIIPSPVGMASNPSYWGVFPYRAVASVYDIMLPMSYSTYRAHGEAETAAYIAESIRIIRERSSDPEIPVHVIGGIASGLTRRETRGLIRITNEYGVMGASVYDLASTNAETWPELEQAPDNPVQHPALPIQLDGDLAALPLGNIPGGDRTHPAQVCYLLAGPAGDHPRLVFEAFDAGADEIAVRVDGRPVGVVGATAPRAWGERQELPVPARLLAEGPHVISFVPSQTSTAEAVWGVRAVALRS